MFLSGAIRFTLEFDQQPNSSLAVLMLGLGLTAFAAQDNLEQLFKQPMTDPRGGLKRLQNLAWQLPLTGICIFSAYRLQIRDFGDYDKLFSEGSVTEWMTFLTFLACSPIALACSLASWKRRERLRAGHHLLLGLGCCVIALEEMSWGQMLFNWDTPALLSEHNAQQETNLHNLHIFQDNLWSITALVIAIALLLTMLRLVLQQRHRLRAGSLLADLLPGPEVLPCLIFALVIYAPVALMKGGLNMPLLVTRDQEVAELAFGLACLIYSSRLYLAQPLRWQRAEQS